MKLRMILKIIGSIQIAGNAWIATNIGSKYTCSEGIYS